jgi:PAS domain-containing protein
MDTLTKWLEWEEPNVWDVCGDIHFRDWEWSRFFGKDFETLISGGWLLEVLPWQLDCYTCYMLIWGTDHAYAEPMGLIGGPESYHRDLDGRRSAVDG